MPEPTPFWSVRECRQLVDLDGAVLYRVVREGSRSDGPIVVFFNSFGADHEAKWRAEVAAGRHFAEKGFTTVSYHPRGHGDSSGNFAELTFEDMVADGLAVADFAATLPGASGIIAVGIRFGALIAAEIIRRRGDVVGLALWEPIHRPRDYFLELMRHQAIAEMARGRKTASSESELIERLSVEASIAVPGQELYRSLTTSALELDLRVMLEAWSGPTLLAQFRRRKELSRDNTSLAKAMKGRGASVTLEVLQEPEGSTGNEAWLFTDSLAASTKIWLDELA
ncbi:MAG TPA: alpha/beta hydrolase [Candidatus Binataceae bacterium]|nr:alpha/beta hydrolase [Candidatus Binataceae bacterium]